LKPEINDVWKAGIEVQWCINIDRLHDNPNHLRDGGHMAAAMFIGIFAFGQHYLGWSASNNDQVQLALFLSFILGILCGYKTKG
jgi:hypothetical protein